MILFLRMCEYSFKNINPEYYFQNHITRILKVLQVLRKLDFNPPLPLTNEADW